MGLEHYLLHCTIRGAGPRKALPVKDLVNRQRDSARRDLRVEAGDLSFRLPGAADLARRAGEIVAAVANPKPGTDHGFLPRGKPWSVPGFP
jgi:hypothetical protein